MCSSDLGRQAREHPRQAEVNHEELPDEGRAAKKRDVNLAKWLQDRDQDSNTMQYKSCIYQKGVRLFKGYGQYRRK